ncbi:MAG: phosphoribosylformylglycinamidine synthase I [Candidatus Omnitrophica bacterium]|jgi:phosphoribosylformylglycinamidine synthase|nr:phosphoribosylformylglycinamidine synthase I [Candidatus Omnitrophota bacterium]
MIKPKVCILRSAGTNCDKETAAAFRLAGAECELLHINSLVNRQRMLSDFHILALPGGFSYGDDIASGKIFANELRFKLADSLRQFIAEGKLIIGICNGFQILVKSGLLPGSAELKQNTSLIINDSGKFESRWVYLKPAGKCVWTKGLKKIIYLPVAHGEGKFVTQDKTVLNSLKKNKQIVFQYCDVKGKSSGYPDNPNGSMENIAGICDETGRVFGLMPHPERHIFAAAHPRNWELKSKIEGDGLQIFRNGVKYVRENL